MRNVHERAIDAGAEVVGGLIDSLASEDDRLWPRDRWPAMRFDRPLGVGARGGHGPIRYSVVEYRPGERAVFEFDPRIGLTGRHGFEVERAMDGHGGTILRHFLEGRTAGRMLLGWPLAFRRLHDALIEDALDRAEAAAGNTSHTPRPHGPWTRALRRLLDRPNASRRSATRRAQT